MHHLTTILPHYVLLSMILAAFTSTKHCIMYATVYFFPTPRSAMSGQWLEINHG